jgi:ribosome-dependent ATPase
VTPAGTHRHEIRCANPARSLALARQIPEVRDATMFGDTLHVLLAESMSADELVNRIAPEDSRAEHRPVEPTLEDVFVLMSRAQAKRLEA